MKKILSLILSAILLAFCLPSCTKVEEEGYFTRTLRDENGRFSVSVARTDRNGAALDEKKLQSIYEEACAVFGEAYDFLTQREQSLLSAINSSVNSIFDVDPELIKEIKKAFELSAATNGLYQPAGGTVTALYSGTETPESSAVSEALLHTGTDKFVLSEDSITKLDRDAKIDFAAYRDGYALNAACLFLGESECAYGTVTFNGIAGVFGQKPDGSLFTVEIGNGADGIFNISDGYVALVSDEFGTAYDFSDGILEPCAKRAAVYSPDAVTAAVISSVGYVHGSEAILSLYESKELTFEAVITEDNGSETFTKNAENGSLYTPITTADSGE